MDQPITSNETLSNSNTNSNTNDSTVATPRNHYMLGKGLHGLLPGDAHKFRESPNVRLRKHVTTALCKTLYTIVFVIIIDLDLLLLDLLVEKTFI